MIPIKDFFSALKYTALSAFCLWYGIVQEDDFILLITMIFSAAIALIALTQLLGGTN